MKHAIKVQSTCDSDSAVVNETFCYIRQFECRVMKQLVKLNPADNNLCFIESVRITYKSLKFCVGNSDIS